MVNKCATHIMMPRVVPRLLIVSGLRSDHFVNQNNRPARLFCEVEPWMVRGSFSRVRSLDKNNSSRRRLLLYLSPRKDPPSALRLD